MIQPAKPVRDKLRNRQAPFLRLRRAALVLLALGMMVPAACSRSVGVATTPAITYAINVTNAAAADLAVAYDDGAGPRALGLVRAGRTERFVIAAPRATTVTISGAAPDGSRTAKPVEIQLLAGTAVDITLR